MLYNDYRFMRAIQLLQKAVLIPFTNKEWLDLGCHCGFLARLLTRYQCNVTGIDVYDPSLQQEKTWRYIQADLDRGKIELASSSFDFVSALEIIEHVTDTDVLFGEVFRILKPGGHWLVSTPNICMIQNRVRVFFGLYPHGLEYRNIIHHVRLYNLSVLVSQLKEHGFQIVVVEGERMMPQNLLQWRVLRFVSEFFSRMFPGLSPNLILVCRRP